MSVCSNNQPSLGVALLLNTFLGIFAADRIYVGQMKWAIGILIATCSVIGLIGVIPIVGISEISLLYSIFTGRSDSFMYPGTCFSFPSMFDKIVGVIVAVFLILTTTLSVVISATRPARS
jgi:TM2 domain-containing membrane protein YozV